MLIERSYRPYSHAPHPIARVLPPEVPLVAKERQPILAAVQTTVLSGARHLAGRAREVVRPRTSEVHIDRSRKTSPECQQFKLRYQFCRFKVSETSSAAHYTDSVNVRIRVRDQIQLRTPDGRVLDTQIASIELLKPSDGSPCRAAIMLPRELVKNDIPIGTEVWLVGSPVGQGQ